MLILYGMERGTEHIRMPEEWLGLSPDAGDGEACGALSEAQAHLWALVLEARHVPCHIEPAGTGWQLLVPSSQLASARNELRLYEEENRYWPPPAPPARPMVENTLPTLSVLILLATFHNLTLLDLSLPGHPPLDWKALGSADAAKILDGQWWRLVTALTLHADWVHLSSNLAIGGVFIVCLCRELGSGLAWSLLLGSGILGNLANACVQPPSHNSLGASTLVFGAVGILAALNMVRYRHQRLKRWLLPVAAALALLALLGTEGEHTDLGAHLFGFLAGAGLGLAVEYPAGKLGRPGRGLNTLLALGSAIVSVGAWWMAVAFGG